MQSVNCTIKTKQNYLIPFPFADDTEYLAHRAAIDGGPPEKTVICCDK